MAQCTYNAVQPCVTDEKGEYLESMYVTIFGNAPTHHDVDPRQSTQDRQNNTQPRYPKT